MFRTFMVPDANDTYLTLKNQKRWKSSEIKKKLERNPWDTETNVLPKNGCQRATKKRGLKDLTRGSKLQYYKQVGRNFLGWHRVERKRNLFSVAQLFACTIAVLFWLMWTLLCCLVFKSQLNDIRQILKVGLSCLYVCMDVCFVSK